MLRFLHAPPPEGAITLDVFSKYSLELIILSYALAVFGSFFAIAILRAIQALHGLERRVGIAIGAIVLAVSIWSMHYTGMLAYNMMMEHRYDLGMTVVSGLVALLFALSVFIILTRQDFCRWHILIGAPLLGLGVAAMHYTGMSAMRMQAELFYRPVPFAISIVIAIAASGAALAIMHQITRMTSHTVLMQFIASLIMGIAVCGMHYTGMAATVFIPFADCRFDPNQDFSTLAMSVAAAACVIIGMASSFLLYVREHHKNNSVENEFAFLIRLKYASFGLKFLVILLIGLLASDIHSVLKETREETAEDNQLYTSIAHLDEVLTMSARMAAATGERKWQQRYEQYEPLLDAAIKKAIQRYPDQYSRAGAEQINVSNQKLISIERQVFAFARDGRLKEARTLIEGDDYNKLKDTYAAGMKTFLDAINADTIERFRHASMQSLFMLILMFPGVTVLIIGVVALLQARKLFNHAVHEQAFSQNVMDAIPDPIFVKNQDHVWRMGNTAFWKLMGGRPERFIGKSDHDIFPAKEVEIFWEKDDLVIRTGLIDINEEYVTGADGNTMIALTTKSPLVLTDGTRGLVGIIHNITPLKKAEKELALHRDNLQAMVDEQISIISQEREKLKEAKEVAEAANTAKSDFLANMSHELRTPLNSIIGMAELLMESQLSTDQDEMLHVMMDSSHNLLEIVNDILDLSKIESNSLELEQIAFSPLQCTQRVINMLMPSASKKGLIMRFHPNDTVIEHVIGDPTRYMRIVTNLISNALKYTEQGRVDVNFSLTPGADAKTHMLTLSVTDSGIGIAQEKLNAIFDKFVQADTSITRKYGGSGLGLSITRQLTEMMHGQIHVKSKPGTGSTFCVEIPFTAASEVKGDIYADVRAEYCGIVPVEMLRVLVAEDHVLNQAYLKKLLPNFGIQHFTIVENGQAAVDAALNGQYDVVLMDCHMPIMSGYDAARAIRAAEAGTERHLPIIAMTANAMIGERERCLECGMDEYISKPINRDKFAEILSRWARLRKYGKGPEIVPSEQVLDLKIVRSFSEGDVAMEKEFVAIFHEQSAQQLERLKSFCVEGISQDWKEIAHMLKGGAGTMGAMKMRALCSEAQSMLNATASERQKMWESIHAAFADVCNELRRSALL